MKRIVMCAPKYFYSKKDTDWRMKLELTHEFASQGVFIPDDFLWNAAYNILEFLCRFPVRFLAKFFGRIAPKIRAQLLERYHADMMLYQGVDPAIPRNCRIIWETYFLYDSIDKQDDPEFRRGGNAFWVKQMEKYGDKVSVIALRGERSCRLLRDMYPEYAHKVVNLTYVRPEYDIVTEEFAVQKQSRAGVVNILFVGREAYRKGLDAVLAACQQLQERGVANFRLTVVSNLHNCKIEVPSVPWITHYLELPHAEVLRLMRNAQIFIMPSRFESYGLVYQESMANGCVTFVRDAEPQREFVDYGKAGVCVSLDDILGMVKELSRCIEHAELRESLAVAGLRRYRAMYSQDVVRAAWKKTLEEGE